jgi:hypothetical protein
MSPSSRDVLLTVKVSAGERDWFHRVAQAKGITLSALVRQSVARQGSRLGLPAPTA